MKMRLEIPLVAPSLNRWYAGCHWTYRQKIAKTWHKAVWIICKTEKIEPITKFPVKIITRTHTKTKSQRDASNCITANKLVEDALVLAGIIPNDTPEYVCYHGVYAPIVGDEDKTIVWVEQYNQSRGRKDNGCGKTFDRGC